MLAPEHMPCPSSVVARAIQGDSLQRAVHLLIVGGRRRSALLESFIRTARDYDWKEHVRSVAAVNSGYHVLGSCWRAHAHSSLSAMVSSPCSLTSFWTKAVCAAFLSSVGHRRRRERRRPPAACTGACGRLMRLGPRRCASVLADNTWYWIARRHGRKVLAQLCRITVSPDNCIRKTEAMYLKIGPGALLFVKFIPGLSNITVSLAGVTGVRPIAFIPLQMSPAFISACPFYSVAFSTARSTS